MNTEEKPTKHTIQNLTYGIAGFITGFIAGLLLFIAMFFNGSIMEFLMHTVENIGIRIFIIPSIVFILGIITMIITKKRPFKYLAAGIITASIIALIFSLLFVEGLRSDLIT